MPRFFLILLLLLFPFLVSWSFPSGITEIRVMKEVLLLPPPLVDIWPDQTVQVQPKGWVHLESSLRPLPEPENP